MTKAFLIGLEAHELHWLRALVMLLRHPDPSVPELARQAIIYLTDAAGDRENDRPWTTPAGSLRLSGSTRRGGHSTSKT